ncbi:MAG TPA: NAD(P)H-dependent oxidoreductase [Cytophagaceae bacterium]|jgi:NAD(P)H dehydrogenase (quinone)
MEKVKLAIIYYSATGANYQLAQWAEEATRNDADVKILKFAETAPSAAIDSNPLWRKNVDNTQHVPEVTLNHLEWADAIIFSVPTRYGSAPSQLRIFFDTTGGLWYYGKLANKVVSAMATASNPHGGQEATIQSIYTSLMHWGVIIAAPGYTDPVTFAAGGNPYGTSATIENGNFKEDVREAVMHQARRTLQVAKWVKAGLSS